MIIEELKITNASGESIEFGRHFRLYEDIDLSGLKADVSYSESSQDGSSYQRTRLDNKDFSVPFFINRIVEENEWIEERRQEAYRVFNPKKNKMKVDFTTKSGKSFYINAELVALPTFPTEFESNNKRWQKGLLQFTASDPYIYEANETLVQIATWVPSFEFPLDIPADLDIYKFPEQIRGGRNLVLKTNQQFDWVSTSFGQILNKTTTGMIAFPGYSTLRGKTLILSLDVNTTNLVYGTTNPWLGAEIRFDHPNGEYTFVSLGNKTIASGTSGNWIRYSRSVTLPDKEIVSSSTLTVLMRDATGSASIKNIKLEIGDKSTPWTPAPEDLGLSYPNWLQNFTESFNENGIVLSENTENTYESCIEMGYRSPSLIANAFNDGQDDIGMIIKFKANGPVTNPSLIDINTYKEFKFKDGFTMANGDIVEVSTYDKNLYARLKRNNITTSIFGQVHLFADWLQLATGDNLFRYDAVDGLDNLEVSMYFTSKFLGV